MVLVLWTWSAAAGPSSLEVVTPGKKTSISLAQMREKLTLKTVEIDDPVYKRKVSFDGFLLTDVFQLAGLTPADTADEIVFTAKDGYSPNMAFSDLKKHEGYLVFQEHGKDQKFEPVQQGKAKISPAPFYVIWKEGAKIENEVPWPYQLVKVEAVRFAEKYPNVFPKDVKLDSPERKGFAIFKSQCIRCHSMNLQGGEVGPELNAPKSVTEYWRTDVLHDFIKDAPAFRYKSKMPSFAKELTDEQIEDLIAYFRYMARHKTKL